VLGKGTTVERAYLVILDTMLLVYFIPYLYLYVCFLVVRLRAPAAVGAGLLAGRPAALAIGLCGFLFTAVAMGMAMIPPAHDDAVAFLLKVVGGAGFFVLLGIGIYWRGRR
jgi:hypothetical protein